MVPFPTFERHRSGGDRLELETQPDIAGGFSMTSGRWDGGGGIEMSHERAPSVGGTATGRHLSRLTWTLGLTGAFLVVEVIGGLSTGSLALLARRGPHADRRGRPLPEPCNAPRRHDRDRPLTRGAGPGLAPSGGRWLFRADGRVT
jgi:hypothetical protein